MKRRRFLAITVGVMVLSVGLVLVNYSGGVTPAMAAPPVKDDAHAGLPQNWDQIIPTAQRFVVLSDFANAAVRDNETGLVWEQSPLTTVHTWSAALGQCTSRTTGGRKGWRLPSVHELASLVDPSQVNPSLPLGHPFTNVLQSASYWSAATSAETPTNAWFVFFGNGLVGGTDKSSNLLAWCVRGGMNADVY